MLERLDVMEGTQRSLFYHLASNYIKDGLELC